MREDSTLVTQRLRAALQAELAPGERLQWNGRPDPHRLKAEFAVWAFAIPWTVFSCVWTGIAASPWLAGPPSDGIGWGFGIAFPLFGLPFILVGFWMLRIPLASRTAARQTIYGLTDRRLIRVTAGKTRKVESVRLDRMGPIHCTTSADGWGTVSIQTGSHVDSDGDRVTDRFVAAAVPEAERLHRLIVAAQGA
jgi:hypothetical protein